MGNGAGIRECFNTLNQITDAASVHEVIGSGHFGWRFRVINLFASLWGPLLTEQMAKRSLVNKEARIAKV
jgi:hypothetical protein